MLLFCCRWQLAGMIVLPMCWKSNEWMGLTIGCSLSTILETVTLNYRVVPEYAHSLTTGYHIYHA